MYNKVISGKNDKKAFKISAIAKPAMIIIDCKLEQ